MTSSPTKTIVFFAVFVAILILLSAYFTERNGLVDEPGFLNPPYMMAHYGKVTFPVYPHGNFFDVPVITHPPVHLGLIGLFWRMGMSPYYAEATPTVLIFLLAILIVVYSGFPVSVKLGWLFSIGFLATTGETLTLCFGTRPEGELHAAWFCGLLLLESGRLANWQRWRLFAGAFFLTWTSGVHYYAGPALFGVVVYMVWAIRSLGWAHAKPRVVALCAGGCLFGVPYLAFYVLPYFKIIRDTITQVQDAGGVATSIQRHMRLYQLWVRELYHPLLVRKAMALGLPMWIATTALLASVRATRGIALAALPLQLGLFLFAVHKMPYYMVHESVIFAGALAVALLSLCQFAVGRYLPKLAPVFAPAAAAVLCLCLISGSPMLAAAELSRAPRFNDTEIAQAAGRRIMGPGARVGGRWWGWYAAGAEHWYDVEHDLSLKFTLLDRNTYLTNLDAIHSCRELEEHLVYNDWFAEGSLKLRGFFYAQSNDSLRCLQLSPRQVSPLVGYAEWKDQLYRFHEDPSGDHAVLSAICDESGRYAWNRPWSGEFSTAMRLSDGPSGGQRYIVTALAPRSSLAPAGPIGAGCRQIARTPGALVPDDRRALMEWARDHEQVMRFHRGIDEMPGYSTVGLPPEAIPPAGLRPVQNVLDLAGITALNGAGLERSPAIRVTTLPLPGAFSAAIPVRNVAAVAGPSWVVLKLRVRRGRIGFGVAVEGGRLLAQTLAIAPSAEPQSVALKVPDIRTARNIILFNQSGVDGQADILDVQIVEP